MRGINIHCFLRGKPINAKKNAFLKFNTKNIKRKTGGRIKLSTHELLAYPLAD